MSPLLSKPALAALIVMVAGSTSFIDTDLVAAPAEPIDLPRAPQPPAPAPEPAAAPQNSAPATQAPVATGPTTAATPAISPADLETTLGPIALYPDPLLAQIFAASTYPLEIVQAARWVGQHPDLAGIEQQPWDPSVMAVARFKSVLTMMDQNLEWTVQLGQAFNAQRQDVMDAVQRLRAKAHGAGSLQSTPQQQVIVESAPAAAAPAPQVIRIVPAQPEVIYVPVYDPQVVYVPRTEVVYVDTYDPWYTWPVYTPVSYCPPRWCAPVWDAAYIGARWDSTWGFAFTIGFGWGSWYNLDCNWYGRDVCYGQWHRDWHCDNDYHGGHDGHGWDGGHGGYGGHGGQGNQGGQGGPHGDGRGNFDRFADAGTQGGRSWRTDARRQPARSGSFGGLGSTITTAAGPVQPGSSASVSPLASSGRIGGDRSQDAGRTGVWRSGGRANVPVMADSPVRLPEPPEGAETRRRGSFNVAPPPSTSAPATPVPDRVAAVKPGADTPIAPAPRLSPAPPSAIVEQVETQRKGSFKQSGQAQTTTPVVVPAPRTTTRSAAAPATVSRPSSAASSPSRSASSPRASAPRAERSAPRPPSMPAPAAGPSQPALSTPAPPARRQGSFGNSRRGN